MELREIYEFNEKCLEESADKKTVRYKAPFMTPGKINKNLRLYPSAVLDQAVSEFNGKIEKGKGWGGSYHPSSGKLEIDSVSHTIQKMYVKDGIAYIEGKILVDNERGKKILSLIKAGSTLGLSVRSFGNIKSENGVNTIQPGLNIQGVDFVLDPSENVAKVNQSNIFESQQIEEKFDVSLEEFNNIVNRAVEHQYLMSFPNANFLETPVKEAFEKYTDKNWAKVAELVEKQLKKLNRTIEKPSQEKETKRVKDEAYPDDERLFDEALVSGYDRTFETFKKEILPALSEKENNLGAEFDEYRKSGGLQDFKKFKKIKGEEK